ncbi:MAG: ribonuclease E [Pseudomonadota bacterium]
MKRMLINATQEEELRVALVDGQRLYDLDIENRTRIQKKASIYKGRITRVEPSLEAAFVDFGAERHGFLPLKEIASEYHTGKSDGTGRPGIKDLVAEGTEVIVQVEKEERGNKGAALTTYISLAGRYLVLMPNNPRAGGISRRIEGDERAEMREIISNLNILDGMGVIVRTAGVGKQQEELQWDLDYLLTLWESITEASKKRSAPFLIFQESNVIIRTIRDYLRQDIGEVLFDTRDAYEEAINFVRQVMPHYESRIKLYEDALPLFNRYQIEAQIESAFQREVKLPSGGSIVIDPTEALISIDINSSRSTRGADIEETALTTNLEAAEEIARQLRLRDMGGLVVIDFIDMSANRNQKEVENRMRDVLEADRARVQVGRISRFGLLEMSRQRLRPSLEETSAIVCPRCNGQGVIRDIKSLCLSILRVLQEEANKQRTAEIRAIVPIAVASYLLNEKRQAVADIETQSNARVIIVPNPHLETPHYEIQNINQQDVDKTSAPSYEIDGDVEPEEVLHRDKPTPPPQKAAVQAPRVTTPRPTSAPATATEPEQAAPRKGLFSSLFSAFSGLLSTAANDEEDEATDTRDRKQQGNRSSEPSRSRAGQRARGGRNNRRGGGGGGRQDSGKDASSGAASGKREENRRQDGSSGKDGRSNERDEARKGSGGNRGDGRRKRSESGNDNRKQPAAAAKDTGVDDENRDEKPRGGRNKSRPPKPRRRGGKATEQTDNGDNQAKSNAGQQDDAGTDQSDNKGGQDDNRPRRRQGRKPRNTTPRQRGPMPEESTDAVKANTPTDTDQPAKDVTASEQPVSESRQQKVDTAPSDPETQTTPEQPASEDTQDGTEKKKGTSGNRKKRSGKKSPTRKKPETAEENSDQKQDETPSAEAGPAGTDTQAPDASDQNGDRGEEDTSAKAPARRARGSRGGKSAAGRKKARSEEDTSGVEDSGSDRNQSEDRKAEPDDAKTAPAAATSSDANNDVPEGARKKAPARKKSTSSQGQTARRKKPAPDDTAAPSPEKPAASTERTPDGQKSTGKESRGDASKPTTPTPPRGRAPNDPRELRRRQQQEKASEGDTSGQE